ncbi:MAG: TonB-dependent receptor [Bacteroidota bacterium]
MLTPMLVVRRAHILLSAAVALTLLLATPAVFGQTGTIAGVVVDQDLGETLIGVNVLVEELGTGAATGLDGDYRIAGVPAGTYTLVVSYLGYNTQRVTGVAVTEGTTTVDVALTEETLELEGEVVVEARALRNNEATLLRDRQKAAGLSDAVSAETISRSGSSNAADAMEKVTGASVQDGRYIYVRGLGDRYMNTQLNGATLPSSDPDRNAVPLDLFPGGLLDNIVTSKTFTPDKPGDFTGGSVNIATKSFPDQLTLGFSSSMSVNTNAAPGSDILAVPDGLGVLGTSDNDLPAALENGDVPTIGETFGNAAEAQELDRLSRSFNASMAPAVSAAPVAQSYSFSLGNRTELAGRPLGFIASANWSRSTSAYDDGRFGQFSLPGSGDGVTELTSDLRLTDQAGSEEVLWGGLANLSYRPAQRHELGLNVLYNRSASQSARLRTGAFPRDLSADQVFETRALETIERTLASAQLRGEHAFSDRGVQAEWNASLARSAQDEPDLRFFSNHFTPGAADTSFTIAANLYPEPTRYFRDLEENSATANLDVTVPVRLFGRAVRVKTGGSFLAKGRTFRERRYEYQRNVNQLVYSGDEDAFFGDQNVGIIGQDDDGRPVFGNYLVDLSTPRNNYDGRQTVAAGYGMVDAAVTDRLRLIAGARVETTDIEVENLAAQRDRGTISEVDVLPSLSSVYALSDRMNVRAAYGRTLARPTFREFAPYTTYDFVENLIYVGNTDLERSLVDNVDLRWEWFFQPGQIVAVSGFFKQFDGPIERVIRSAATNLEVEFNNLESAQVYGLEMEARTGLGFAGRALRHFQAGANLTLVQSVVDIDAAELAQIRASNPEADDTRSLQGQSPYVVNLDFGYENLERGTAISLFFNVFGERLYAVARGGAPNYFEQPRSVLDVVASQEVGRGFTVKLSAKNLLDARYEIVQTFRGRDFVNRGYSQGRAFSLGVSYSL